MILIEFVITSVKYLKLLSGKFLHPMISLKWTFYNYLLYAYTVQEFHLFHNCPCWGEDYTVVKLYVLV